MFACIVGMMFSSSAIFFSTLGVFIKPISAEFGWGRTQLTSAASFAALASALATPLFGRMIDARGARRIIIASIVILSTAMISLCFLPKNYFVYIAIALVIGVAGTGTTTFAYLSILPAWFGRRLGLSLSFATIGFGLGQTLGPLYGNLLIKAVGWREGYALLGLSALVVTLPNALFLLRDGPSGTTTAIAAADKREGLSAGEALKTAAFWRLAVSFCFITMAVTGCTLHLVPLLTDRGLSVSTAAGAAAAFGASMLLTRFVTGMLLDYVSARLLGFGIFGGCALGIALIFSGLPGAALLLGIVLLGAGLGVEADLIPYLTRQVFGLHAYGTIYSFLFAAFNIGVVVGPLLMAVSFDRSGSYATGLAVLLGLAAIAAGLLLIKLPSHLSNGPSRSRVVSGGEFGAATP